MEKVFKKTAQQHGNKKALGTRKVIGEEDEVQENGRVFKKVPFFNFDFMLIDSILTNRLIVNFRRISMAHFQ